MKPKRGRPAPLGRKVVCSVRLTPDVAEFCRQHPDGFPVLESTLRASKAFKAWLKTNQERSGGRTRQERRNAFLEETNNREHEHGQYQ